MEISTRHSNQLASGNNERFRFVTRLCAGFASGLKLRRIVTELGKLSDEELQVKGLQRSDIGTFALSATRDSSTYRHSV